MSCSLAPSLRSWSHPPEQQGHLTLNLSVEGRTGGRSTELPSERQSTTWPDGSRIDRYMHYRRRSGGGRTASCTLGSNRWRGRIRAFFAPAQPLSEVGVRKRGRRKAKRVHYRPLDEPGREAGGEFASRTTSPAARP